MRAACPDRGRRVGHGVRPTAQGVCGSGKSSIFMPCMSWRVIGSRRRRLRRMHVRIAPRAFRITELCRCRERLELLPHDPDQGSPLSTKNTAPIASQMPPTACRSRHHARPRSARRGVHTPPFCLAFGHHSAMPVPIITSVQQPASSITSSPVLPSISPRCRSRICFIRRCSTQSVPSTAPVYGFTIHAFAFARRQAEHESALRRGSVPICAVVGTASRGSLAAAFASRCRAADAARPAPRRSSGRDKAAARSAAGSSTACR